MASLHHLRRGSGPPLVLVHPLGGEHRVWDPVLDLLAAERDVIAPDLPGFGASPLLTNGATPTAAALAEAVAGLLDELGIDAAHAAGISLGGWICLELAARGRATSVTAIAPAGLWSRPLGPDRAVRRRAVARLLVPALRPLFAIPALRRRALADAVAHPERVPAAAAARIARSYLTAPAYEAANREMRAGRFEDAARLDLPVTVAWAEHDRRVKRARHEIPGARTLVLRDCGHVPTWDDPEQVARVVLETSEE